MRQYVQKKPSDPTKLRIEGRTSPNANTICRAPQGVTDADIITLEDVLDEFTSEVIGKRAVVDPVKQAAKEALVQASQDAETAREGRFDTRMEALRVGLTDFATLTRAQKDVLLKRTITALLILNSKEQE